MSSNISKDDQEALLDAFKQYLYSEDSSRNTTSAYLSDLAHFFAWYSQVEETFDIESITPTDIRGYRESLQEQVPALSPATVNRRLAALRRFFTWATEQHVISASPAHRIRNVESTLHGPKSLDRKQWNRLLRTVEQAKGDQGVRDRCIVLLLYHTGIRAGELAVLRVSDITLGERSGNVQIRRGKGNYNGPRNLDTKRGEHKIYSKHDEKKVYRRFQSQSGAGPLEGRENLGPNCFRV